MSNYSTNLKDWGAEGTEYPNGYSYLEGDQPVDAWDNYFNYNVINDIQHLIGLTNDRLESDTGSSHPSSPEVGHISHRTDTPIKGKETLYHYDSTNSEWHRLMKADGDKMTGNIDMGGYSINDTSGTLTLNSDVHGTGSVTVDGKSTFNDSISIPDSSIDANSVKADGSSLTKKYFQSSENGEAVTGSLSIVGIVGLDNNETMEVTQAAMIKHDLSPVSSGIDLVLSTGTNKRDTLLSGDGSTIFGDENPGVTYTNTSGSSEVILVAVDNGHHNTGAGTNEKVHSSFIAKVN